MSEEMTTPDLAEAEADAEQPEPCGHAWTVMGAQEVPQGGFVFGKPVPQTAVLLRCADCGDVTSRVLTGDWTAALETERDETDT